MAVVPTPLLYATPRRVLTPDRDWDGFDPQGFSHEFEWRQDALSGFWDTLQPVGETIERGRGDCEDYAAVVASYLLAETDTDVSLAYLWRGSPFTDGHTVAYTDDKVYSSGQIFRKSLAEYKAASPYTHAVTRSV